MVIKPADLTAITKSIDIAVRAALTSYMEEHKKMKIVAKVNSNNLTHSGLEPEGHLFTAQIAVELHEKTTE